MSWARSRYSGATEGRPPRHRAASSVGLISSRAPSTRARMARRGWSSGTTSSSVVMTMNPPCRSSPPRILPTSASPACLHSSRFTAPGGSSCGRLSVSLRRGVFQQPASRATPHSSSTSSPGRTTARLEVEVTGVVARLEDVLRQPPAAEVVVETETAAPVGRSARARQRVAPAPEAPPARGPQRSTSRTPRRRRAEAESARFSSPLAVNSPRMGAEPDTLLRLTDLTVDFASQEGIVHAVNKVSFQVAPGELVGLVGESGCGKSVTAMSVIGLISRPAGSSAARSCSTIATSRSIWHAAGTRTAQSIAARKSR